MLPKTNFEKRKIKLSIERYGTQAKIFCYKKNSFGEELEGEINIEFETKGLLHTEKQYVKVQRADSGITVTKFVPMLLCEYDMVKTIIDDPTSYYVEIANNLYRVNGISDVGDSGYAIDISLEAMDYVKRPV